MAICNRDASRGRATSRIFRLTRNRDARGVQFKALVFGGCNRQGPKKVIMSIPRGLGGRTLDDLLAALQTNHPPFLRGLPVHHRFVRFQHGLFLPRNGAKAILTPPYQLSSGRGPDSTAALPAGQRSSRRAPPAGSVGLKSTFTVGPQANVGVDTDTAQKRPTRRANRSSCGVFRVSRAIRGSSILFVRRVVKATVLQISYIS